MRSSRIRVVVLPVFDVPRFEKLSDKTKKPFICNTLLHNADEYIVVYVIEEAFYVSLNKPLCTCKSPLNACQSCVAALMRSETMRGAFKVPLIDGFKNHPNYLLHKLVLYGWYTKRAFLAVLLWYIHPFSRMRLVGFIPKCFDETFNSSNAHLVDSLTICAWSHIAWLRIYALIGNEEHLFVEQNAVQSLKLIVRDLTVLA